MSLNDKPNKKLIKQINKAINSDIELNKFVEFFDPYKEIPIGTISGPAHRKFFEDHLLPPLQNEYQITIESIDTSFAQDYRSHTLAAIELCYQQKIQTAHCDLFLGNISDDLKKMYNKCLVDANLEEHRLRQSVIDSKIKEVVDHKAHKIAEKLGVSYDLVLEVIYKLCDL